MGRGLQGRAPREAGVKKIFANLVHGLARMRGFRPHGVGSARPEVTGQFSVGNRRIEMTKLISALAALSFLAVTIVPAQAHCPTGTRYDCTTSWGGKQECGC